MDLFKSGNPTLSEKRFKDTVLDDVITHTNAMTVKGTLQKFGFLGLIFLFFLNLNPIELKVISIGG